MLIAFLIGQQTHSMHMAFISICLEPGGVVPFNLFGYFVVGYDALPQVVRCGKWRSGECSDTPDCWPFSEFPFAERRRQTRPGMSHPCCMDLPGVIGNGRN